MDYKTIVMQIPGYLFASGTSIGIDAIGLQLISKTIIHLNEYKVKLLISVGCDNFQNSIEYQALDSPRHIRDTTARLGAQINGIVLLDKLTQSGVAAKLLTDLGVSIAELIESYSPNLASTYLEEGNVVISTTTIEQGLFEDDLTAALRAVEINGDALYKVTSFALFPTLQSYTQTNRLELSYDKAIQMSSQFPIKSSAVSFCSEHHLPIIIFDISSSVTASELLSAKLSTSNGVLIMR